MLDRPDWASPTVPASTPWTEGDPCQLCGEPEDSGDDVLAECWVPAWDDSVLAHVRRGIDHGLTPA